MQRRQRTTLQIACSQACSLRCFRRRVPQVVLAGRAKTSSVRRLEALDILKHLGQPRDHLDGQFRGCHLGVEAFA